MSHVFSFSLITMFLHYTLEWIKKPTLFLTVIMGMLAGLIVLIRPVNGLIVIFPALIAVPQNLTTYLDRKNGYIDALRKNGIAFDESLIIVNTLTSDEGVPAIQKLMSLPNPPDAIFCGNDTTALSVMIYLRDKGIRIPEDIGIVGFSNEPFSRVVSPLHFNHCAAGI